MSRLGGQRQPCFVAKVIDAIHRSCHRKRFELRRIHQQVATESAAASVRSATRARMPRSAETHLVGPGVHSPSGKAGEANSVFFVKLFYINNLSEECSSA